MQSQAPRMASLQRADSDSEDYNHDDNGETNLKNKGHGGQKGVINRVNRACNHCRRMKMRCVGAEEPPCKRCRNSGLECVMEKPGRGGADPGIGDDRIKSLESQVSAIQNTLTDLVSTLRAGMTTQPTPPAPSAPPAIIPSNVSFNPPTVGNPQRVPDTTSMELPFWAVPSPSRSFNDDAMMFAALGAGQNFGFPPKQEVILPSRPVNDGSDPGSTSSFQTHPSPFTSTVPGGMPGLPLDSFRRDATNLFQWAGQNHNPQKSPHTPPHPSTLTLPPSRAGSLGPEDILGPEEITNPLGAMSNMAGLVEAAVERAREEGKSPLNNKRGSEMISTDAGITKRARFSPPDPTGPAITEAQNLPPTIVNKERKKSKRTHIHAYPDAVAEGYVTEAEGRELMKIFYDGSSSFIPCFDPNIDHWDALRLRSPFSLTTIIMVGARVRDGGGPPSDVQRACRAHAQRIAVGTLFNPVARIEAVQAMMLLAAFSESGWLPGGHAVRMAIDMGINRSFIHLLRSGMGKGKTREELEEERHLVVHSRVWFCLYLVEHQMAYGMGRPAILREDETIHNCRRLLEHPLSITSDARLVSTVELTALRAPLHIELTASPDLPLTDITLQRLKQANSDFDAWERYWDRILSERFGKGRGDFFRESLIIQRQYAELFVNSQLLRGIREPADVTGMPEEQRRLAIRAMRNAQRCLDICLRGENYRNGLRYAVHYSHVCAAFAASFLIRIARLFPHELHLKQTAKDVEELAQLLAEVPAGRYARSLQLILRRARRAKVIPAPSTRTSPKPMLATPLPTEPNVSSFSPSQLVNPAYYPTPSGIITLPTGQIINDSPSSGGDNFEFDSIFAQETLERAGLTMGEGDQLPLFLDGQSLGSTAAPTEMTPYVGIESFFLPAEVDNRLAGPSGLDGMSQMVNNDPLGGHVWW